MHSTKIYPHASQSRRENLIKISAARGLCLGERIHDTGNYQARKLSVTCDRPSGGVMGTGFGDALRWRHNGRDSISNHQPYRCLLNRLFRRRSKKTSKLRVTGLCVGNSPGTGEFRAQMASNAENVSIWWRQHGKAGFSVSTPARGHQAIVLIQWKAMKTPSLPLKYKYGYLTSFNLGIKSHKDIACLTNLDSGNPSSWE